ncbi:MAG TPA: selenide, water dikinase SelD [Syntrophorhabdaceae bacterium]|nr:selenide, water dikinase SelD [Syntrophorhabdaceae bacterium]
MIFEKTGDDDIKMTNHTRFGGCAAKIGPGDLSDVLCGLEIPEDENVICGIKGFEDAGIYKINENLALVQTVDFFTPVVNDPYWFGQIAAANALSDIYAMGARPLTALNIVCFSVKKFGTQILREILRGGIDKLKESKTNLLGGHSVEDEEIKYGLSVTGLVRIDKIIRNEGARPGDVLIITKPIGTGIMINGIKAGIISKSSEGHLIKTMATLNSCASEIMVSVKTHAATDVTGFGLAGHIKEMIKENLGIILYANKIPHFHEVIDLASSGFFPSGFYRNRDFYIPYVRSSIKGPIFDIIFDPQSSGGLLIALQEDEVHLFKKKAYEKHMDFWVIGSFVEEPKGMILVE